MVCPEIDTLLIEFSLVLDWRADRLGNIRFWGKDTCDRIAHPKRHEAARASLWRIDFLRRYSRVIRAGRRRNESTLSEDVHSCVGGARGHYRESRGRRLESRQEYARSRKTPSRAGPSLERALACRRLHKRRNSGGARYRTAEEDGKKNRRERETRAEARRIPRLVKYRRARPR